MLWLRFVVNKGATSELIMSPAKLNDFNQYKDALFVYTERGKFRIRNIKGPIEEYIPNVTTPELSEDL